VTEALGSLNKHKNSTHKVDIVQEQNNFYWTGNYKLETKKYNH